MSLSEVRSDYEVVVLASCASSRDNLGMKWRCMTFVIYWLRLLQA
jgi:hypothetical protein